MTWKLQTAYAANTSSRYAFYQTFWLAAEGMTTGVGIIHYGKLNGTVEETSRRPLDGGNYRLFGRCTQGLVQTKMGEKTSKDYSFIDRNEITFDTEDELRGWLTQNLGAARRDELSPYLFLKAGDYAEGPTPDAPAIPEDDDPDIAPPMTALDDSTVDPLRGAW